MWARAISAAAIVGTLVVVTRAAPAVNRARHESLVIHRFILVESRAVAPHLVEDVYRAEVKHRRHSTQDLAGVRATIVPPFHFPLPGIVQVVDGTLEFGAVRVGSTVTSRDTIAIRRHRLLPVRPRHFGWDFSGRPDVLVPESWAGKWQLTLTWTNPETQAPLGIDTIETIIAADEPVGFSLLPDSVTCTWTATGDSIEGVCGPRTAVLLAAPAMARFTLARTGAGLEGRVEWNGSAAVACGTASDPNPKSVAIAGQRLSPDAEPAPHSSGVLPRISSYPALIRLLAGVTPQGPTLACPDFSFWVPFDVCAPIIPCDAALLPAPQGYWLFVDADGDGIDDGSGINPHVIVRDRTAVSAFDLRVCGGADAGTGGGTINAIFEYANASECGTGRAAVTVSARLAATATAAPGEIAPGETTQLSAHVSGGIPPYSYMWSPEASLVSPPGVETPPHLLAAPLAAPAVTTIYRLTVVDAAGQFLGQQPGQNPSRDTETPVFVTVTVNAADPPPAPSFTFSTTCCPPTIRLDASASSGNIVSYAWDLSWTAASPDGVTTLPTTAFPFFEGDRGTITLTVTAVDGQAATFTRSYPR
jgi:hypothetical protein